MGKEEQCAVLEVLSGPEDGLVIPITNTRFLIGPQDNAMLKLAYGTHVLRENVEILLGEDKLTVSGLGAISFGEPFQIGHVWLRVLKSEKEG